MKGFDFGIQVISQAMSLRMKKHALISGNIANADTPGFRPKAMSFEAELQKAVQSGSSSQIHSIRPRVEVVDDRVPRLDGNSVNTDKQMAELTENSMMYSASAEFLKKKISMLKRVIT